MKSRSVALTTARWWLAGKGVDEELNVSRKAVIQGCGSSAGAGPGVRVAGQGLIQRSQEHRTHMDPWGGRVRQAVSAGKGAGRTGNCPCPPKRAEAGAHPSCAVCTTGGLDSDRTA